MWLDRHIIKYSVDMLKPIILQFCKHNDIVINDQNACMLLEFVKISYLTGFEPARVVSERKYAS